MQKKFYKIYTTLGALAMLIFFGFANFPQQNLKITFLDIGQGDAILIRTPLNQKILVDAGPAANILPAISEELGFFEKKIQLMVITHPDADHIAGFTEILQRYKVENILLTGVQHNTQWYADILRQISEQKIPTIIANSNSDFRFGEVIFDTFWPEENIAGSLPADANAVSIATRISYGDTAVILTGDLDTESELEILQTQQNLQAQILKLGHHGSRTSTAPEFLAAVNPDIVVISASADNKFGHPHAEVMERVADKQIFETAKTGNISFVSDGVNWSLQ
jgi:competence protein ComEC